MKYSMKQLFILCLGIIIILMSSCSESQKMVNIALQKDGKTYLYSVINNRVAIEHLAANGSEPTIMNSTSLVYEDKQFFMEASTIKTISNVLGGNVELFPTQEKSFDGYFIEGKNDIFSLQMKNEDNGDIAKIAGVMEINLKNQKTHTSFPIKWQITPKLKAIENCEIQSLTVRYSQNSSNEFTSKDFVMVNLEDINQFFGGNYTLRYDRRASLLYVQEKTK